MTVNWKQLVNVAEVTVLSESGRGRGSHRSGLEAVGGGVRGDLADAQQ
jgi:hypothetical protein